MQQVITQDGHTVDVRIYRSTDSLWVLEVVNAAGTSTCWDDLFATDREALDAVLRTIREEGIAVLAVDDPANTLQ